MCVCVCVCVCVCNFTLHYSYYSDLNKIIAQVIAGRSCHFSLLAGFIVKRTETALAINETALQQSRRLTIIISSNITIIPTAKRGSTSAGHKGLCEVSCSLRNENQPSPAPATTACRRPQSARRRHTRLIAATD